MSFAVLTFIWNIHSANKISMQIFCNNPEQITLLPTYHRHAWSQTCKAITDNDEKKFDSIFTSDLANKVGSTDKDSKELITFMTLLEFLVTNAETDARTNMMKNLCTTGAFLNSTYDVIKEEPYGKTAISSSLSHQAPIYYAIMSKNVGAFKILYGINSQITLPWQKGVELVPGRRNKQRPIIEQVAINTFLEKNIAQHDYDPNDINVEKLRTMLKYTKGFGCTIS